MSLARFDLTRLLGPPVRAVARRWPRAFTAGRRARLALRLLLGGRLGLFVIVDLLVAGSGLFVALVEGGRVPHLFQTVVVVPTLILGIPALADLVALERRAGSLELALSVPSPLAYFLRRAAPVPAVLLAQGALVLVVAWVSVLGGPAKAVAAIPSEGGLLLRALVGSVLVVSFVTAVVLFWAVHLRSAGAVMVATGLTLVPFLPWLTAGPALATSTDRLLGIPTPLLGWGGDVVVLAGAGAVFFLYARDRLARSVLVRG